MKIAKFSIQHPRAIAGLLVLLVILGIYSYIKTPVAYTPHYYPPMLEIMTFYPGAGSDEVKNEITDPILQALYTLGDCEHKESVSSKGFSWILIEFDVDQDREILRLRCQEIVDSLYASKFSKNIQRPVVKVFAKERANTNFILYLKAKAKSDKLVPFCEEYISEMFYKIPGVNDVLIKGLQKQEVLVNVDINALQKYKIPSLLIYEKLALFGKNQPIGKITESEKNNFYTLDGKFTTLEQVRQTPIRFYNNDQLIRLEDLASVNFSSAKRDVIAKHNEEEVVTFYLVQDQAADVKKIKNSLDELIPKIRSQSKISFENKDTEIGYVLNGYSLVESTLSDLESEFIVALILITLIVYLFLGSIWSSFITIIAVPISFLGALIFIYFYGFNIDSISLTAFIVALGLVVDDAMISRESIYGAMQEGCSKKEAALIGIRRVYKPVLTSTICIAFVFLGSIFMKGVIAFYLFELGSVVAVALLVSFLDSMTIAPLMSIYGPNIKPVSKTGLAYRFNIFHRGFIKLFDIFHKIYLNIIEHIEKRFKVLTVVIASLLFIFSIYLAIHLGFDFLPPPSNPTFSVKLEMPFSTSQEGMEAVSNEISSKIQQIKGIKSVTELIGSPYQENVSTLYINISSEELKKQHSNDFMLQVDDLLENYKYQSNNNDLAFFFFDAGNYAHYNNFGLFVYGTNTKSLENVSRELYTLLVDHPGLKSLRVRAFDLMKEHGIRINKEKALAYGVDTQKVGQELGLLVSGASPTIFTTEEKSIPIQIKQSILKGDFNTQLPKYSVPNINNILVPLGDIATVEIYDVPTVINTYKGYPSYKFTADLILNGAGLGSVINDVKSMMNILLANQSDINYKFLGTTKRVEKMTSQLIFIAILSLIFIYFVLSILYESFIFPLILMFSLPFGLCGTFYALWIFNQNLNIYSFAGIIIVIGVAAKNGIIFVDAALEQVRNGRSGDEGLKYACKERFRPILMTSASLFIGMLPVAMSVLFVERQQVSMGISVIGGVVTSSTLSLIVLPIFLRPFLNREAKAVELKKHQD
jgi:HAE1 family hydrophobic/amphiphilic exporter-1